MITDETDEMKEIEALWVRIFEKLDKTAVDEYIQKDHLHFQVPLFGDTLLHMCAFTLSLTIQEYFKEVPRETIKSKIEFFKAAIETLLKQSDSAILLSKKNRDGKTPIQIIANQSPVSPIRLDPHLKNLEYAGECEQLILETAKLCNDESLKSKRALKEIELKLANKYIHSIMPSSKHYVYFPDYEAQNKELDSALKELEDHVEDLKRTQKKK